MVSNSADYFTLKHAISYGVSGGRVVNCIVQGNASDSGEEVNVWGSELVHTVTNGADFADAAQGDWHLVRGGAGVGTGDLAYVMDATDLGGLSRTTTNAEGKVTVNCGCYERVSPCLIHVTYTGIDPYGTNEFREVEGNGPLVPRGYAVTELMTNGVSVAKLPRIDEPLVTGVSARMEVVVRFVAARYADAEHGDDANDGLSPDKAKKSLQAAIGVAPEGRTAEDSVVFASPGIYAPIETEDRILTVFGTEGAAKTIIDGGSTSRCANLGVGIDKDGYTNTVLRGFTVRNGFIWDYRGSGVHGGTVVDCILHGNWTRRDHGGACAYSSVRNSLIYDNRVTDMANGLGSAVFCGQIVNCTVVDNRTSGDVGVCAAVRSSLAVNCIIQGNRDGRNRECNYDADKVPGLVSSITNGAVFADAANGDYHLVRGSAGIAAGDVAAVVDETDLEGNRRTTTSSGVTTVSCGCYERTVGWYIRMTYTGTDPYGTNEFLTVDGNGPLVPRGSEVLELAVNGVAVTNALPRVGEPLLTEATNDTAVAVRFRSFRYADAQHGDDANDGLSPDRAKKTLQAAIDAAPAAVSDAADSVVFAASGTYAPIVCPNLYLSVIGTGGPGQVAIDAKNTSSRCATLRGSDSVGTNTVLSGFTLRNGNWNGSSDVVNGGGAYGGTLIGCVITNCCASQFGGGAACSMLRNCLVARNRALAYFAQNPPGAGGYAVWCSNCTIADNAAPNTRTTYGLGLSVESGSMVVNSIVQGNTGLYGESGMQVFSPLDMKSTIESGAVFVDAANGDYHLMSDGAGVAAGNVGYVMDATDLEGAARLTTNATGVVTVNCGCYETVKRVIRFVTIVDCGETYQIPYAWLETYGLAPNGSDYDVHYTSATNASANPVGPGATEVLPAWKSYVAGLDPTNALEMFYSVITAPSNGWFRVGPNEVRQGRAYAVRETSVLRGAAVTNLWPIAEGRDAVDVESNGTNSFFKVNVRVNE